MTTEVGTAPILGGIKDDFRLKFALECPNYETVPHPPTPPIALVTCGSRLRGPIAARMAEYGFEVGDATTLLSPERLRMVDAVRTVIVSLDPARTRSGLAILAAARREAPLAQRILIAPRSSRLVRPAMASGLVQRTWLLPVGARLLRLLEAFRPPDINVFEMDS